MRKGLPVPQAICEHCIKYYIWWCKIFTDQLTLLPSGKILVCFIKFILFIYVFLQLSIHHTRSLLNFHHIVCTFILTRDLKSAIKYLIFFASMSHMLPLIIFSTYLTFSKYCAYLTLNKWDMQKHQRKHVRYTPKKWDI